MYFKVCPVNLLLLMYKLGYTSNKPLRKFLVLPAFNDKRNKIFLAISKGIICNFNKMLRTRPACG